jgi:hypothetical protein
LWGSIDFAGVAHAVRRDFWRLEELESNPKGVDLTADTDTEGGFEIQEENAGQAQHANAGMTSRQARSGSSQGLGDLPAKGFEDADQNG